MWRVRVKLTNTQSMSFQIKFGKKSVADFSKECAFPLPQRKFHCVVISFSGSAEVAAGLSNLRRVPGLEPECRFLALICDPSILSALRQGLRVSGGSKGVC